MNVVVINGSPKGEQSITYQYVRYIRKVLSKDSFSVHHVGQRIKRVESDKEAYAEVIKDIEKADLVIWSYPVYTFLMPSQLMRFMELAKERGNINAFEGKYTTQVITSKHFFDTMAHNYVHHNCEDMGMLHLYGHMADTDDMKKKSGQKQLVDFALFLKRAVEGKRITKRKYVKYEPKRMAFEAPSMLPIEKKDTKKVVLITDHYHKNTSLDNMIDYFIKAMPYEVKVIDLHEISMKSGCIGCLRCIIEKNCMIKDDYYAIFNTIQKADSVIYAGTLINHGFSSRYKMFDDRQFVNGHRITQKGKIHGYIISGQLSKELEFHELIDAKTEVSRAYLTDIVTDEDSFEIVATRLKQMAKDVALCLEQEPERPTNFYGDGGMRIFRDLIFTMRGFMQEDHKYYRAHKLYNFPQRQYKDIVKGYIIGIMLLSKTMRGKILPKLSKMILSPYETIVNGYETEDRDSNDRV